MKERCFVILERSVCAPPLTKAMQIVAFTLCNVYGQISKLECGKKTLTFKHRPLCEGGSLVNLHSY